MKANSGQAPSTLIPEYIGSDFDKVIQVSENLEYIKSVAEGIAGMPVKSYIGEFPPQCPVAGSEWYCTKDGRTYVWYAGVDSSQWVESSPQSTNDGLERNLDTILDPKYKQIREALRRSYAEAGYNLVQGSFEKGGVLTSTGDVLLYERDGKAYSWTGAYPSGGHVVGSGTAPASDILFISVANANPFQGFKQAALTAAGMTNDGNPDTVNSSQVLDALSMYLTGFYASKFATKDVKSDQGAALQRGYDAAVAAGKEFIVDGVFWVNAVRQSLGTPMSNDMCAILLRSNSKIIFLPGSSINVLPNSAEKYYVLAACLGVHDIDLINPVVIGDRKDHTYTASSTHEWGYGICIYESSSVKIINANVSQMTGDGIYVGKAWGSMITFEPTDILIDNPKIHHVRRNGISLTSYNGLTVRNPDISFCGDSDGITGAFPKSCIDVESESADGAVVGRSIGGLITSPYLHDSSFGLCVYSIPLANETRALELSIDGEFRIKKISNTGVMLAIHPNTSGYLDIESIRFVDSIYIGITAAIGKSNTIKPKIGTVHYVGTGVAINLDNAGQKSNRIIGNLHINNFINNDGGFAAIMSSAATIGKIDSIDDLVIMSQNKYKKGASWYYEDNHPTFLGSGSYVETTGYSYQHTGWSAETKKMPNIIWQNPSIDTAGKTEISIIVSAGDNRVLQIGLDPATNVVGLGCNIRGLNLKIDGVTKTHARCTMLGGSITLQNTAAGYTSLIGMVGTWFFD